MYLERLSPGLVIILRQWCGDVYTIFLSCPLREPRAEEPVLVSKTVFNTWNQDLEAEINPWAEQEELTVGLWVYVLFPISAQCLGGLRGT